MISADDVKHVAALARIHFEDKEIEKFTKNLKDILHYIEKLNELDVSKIKPTSHVLPLKNVYREDKVIPSLTQEEALKFAVEKKDGAFKVPKIIE